MGWGAMTDMTFVRAKSSPRVRVFFRLLRVGVGDGPWQDVKGLDEVGSDTGRTGE
ncbi:phage tail fiber C-terminal domain-containing protein, partial [Escherichia coli]|uniref:phage tail fiber C-terminal domain-containing protein n=1 Tax=Escherichia coli TaxID=562 RepID=UPI0015933D8C